MLRKTTTLACVVLGATLSTARADDTDATVKPAASGGTQLTLPVGRLVLDGFLEINLSSGEAFKPFSITPDLWYGATPDITVGLVHSQLGETGFIGGVGDSLCLTGTGNGGCSGVYENVGVDVRYKLKAAGITWAADGGLFIDHISNPFLLSLKLGIVGRWAQSDKLTIDFAPNFLIGITNRSVDDGNGGTVTTNPDFFNIPVAVNFEVAPKIVVSGQTGVVLPFENTGDAYRIPLSIGAHYTLDQSTTLTAALSFPSLIAGTGGGLDARTITLGGTYAF